MKVVGFVGPLADWVTPAALKLSKSNVLKPVGGAGVAGTTFSDIDLLRVCAGEALSETVAVKMEVPVVGGVPLNTPAGVKLSQFGSPVALQRIEAIPPVDARLITKGVLTVSVSDGLVVIVSGAATRMLSCLKTVSPVASVT